MPSAVTETAHRGEPASDNGRTDVSIHHDSYCEQRNGLLQDQVSRVQVLSSARASRVDGARERMRQFVDIARAFCVMIDFVIFRCPYAPRRKPSCVGDRDDGYAHRSAAGGEQGAVGKGPRNTSAW